MNLIFRNYVSAGDFVDLYHILRLKGLTFLIKSLRLAPAKRGVSKWNRYECSQTDFWALEKVKERWNYKCTGDSAIEYEQYVTAKYLKEKENLVMLSVGCGNSSHEQAFSKHGAFRHILGIDNSEKQIIKARACAMADGFKNIEYRHFDFEKGTLKGNSYDLILFHSSLHHFPDIKQIITDKTLPVLKKGGLLVLCDYTGPNKLQWTKEQVKKASQMLGEISNSKRTWPRSKTVKRKVYTPGLLRMWISDPSEACDSESILEVMNIYFENLEEKKLGGNLIHPLLKGISHHFADDSPHTRSFLRDIFEREDEFLKENKSDFTFGVYQKK